jgi:3-hydroxyisobutyrate dehydrogenase-like beta-hydroxyacid dehydrogenase
VAKNLVAAGHDVHVSDVSAGAVAELVAAGATAGGSAAEVAAACPTVITMLPGPALVRKVFEEVGPALAKGAVYIDASTGAVQQLQQ